MTDKPAPSRALNISLWIAQILLALLFGFAGSMKAFVAWGRIRKAPITSRSGAS